MIIALLIKFFYMLKIHMMQNINVLLKTWKNVLENLKDSKTFIKNSS